MPQAGFLIFFFFVYFIYLFFYTINISDRVRRYGQLKISKFVPWLFFLTFVVRCLVRSVNLLKNCRIMVQDFIVQIAGTCWQNLYFSKISWTSSQLLFCSRYFALLIRKQLFLALHFMCRTIFSSHTTKQSFNFWPGPKFCHHTAISRQIASKTIKILKSHLPSTSNV